MIRLVKLTATAVWFPCLVYALASAIARPVRVVVPEPTEDLYVPHHDRLAAVARWN